MHLMPFRTFFIARPCLFLRVNKSERCPDAAVGRFFSEILCVFYSSYSVYSSYISIKNDNHCYAMGSPFHIDRCAITMPWARRFI